MPNTVGPKLIIREGPTRDYLNYILGKLLIGPEELFAGLRPLVEKLYDEVSEEISGAAYEHDTLRRAAIVQAFQRKCLDILKDRGSSPIIFNQFKNE